MEIVDGNKIVMKLEVYDNLISELNYLRNEDRAKSIALGNLERTLRDKNDLIALLLEKINITNKDNY